MLARSTKLLLVLTLTLSLGAHWAFLQSIAWVGMVVSYSRDGSFLDAVSKTFDGRHPCSLCKAIKQGRSEEKEQDSQQAKSGSKLEMGLVWSSDAFKIQIRRDPQQIVSTDPVPTSRADTPPTPPPRLT